MSLVPGTMAPPIWLIVYCPHVAVAVGVGVGVNVAVAVAVGVRVGVAEAAAVGVAVGVDVAVAVAVGVGVGVPHTTCRKAMSLRFPVPVFPINVDTPVAGLMV